MLEQITGFLTSAYNSTGSAADTGLFGADISSGTINPAVWIILAILIGWAVLLGLAYLVLAIISCVKQKIPLSGLLNRSFSSFEKLWKPMLRYYIPLIIISSIVGLYQFTSNILGIFSEVMPTLESVSALLSIVFLPAILAEAIYMSLLDNSLAKSYYESLKTNKFAFRWISFGEFMRLIGAGLLYILIIFASFLLLGIPLLFLPVISLFFRFPLLNEGASIGGAISKPITMLKKDFWNIFFFYFIYSVIVGVASVLIQLAPVVGYVAVCVIVVPLSTLLSAEAYYLLSKGPQKPKAASYPIKPARR